MALDDRKTPAFASWAWPRRAVRPSTVMTYLITGAAGFIGSNLVDRLLANGETVIGYDNLSTGKMRFLEAACANSKFRFIKSDLLDTGALTSAMQGTDLVFHLAANADVRFGIE